MQVGSDFTEDPSVKVMPIRQLDSWRQVGGNVATAERRFPEQLRSREAQFSGGRPFGRHERNAEVYLKYVPVAQALVSDHRPSWSILVELRTFPYVDPLNEGAILYSRAWITQTEPGDVGHCEKV